MILFLRLIAETLLYYLTCSLLARKREDAPGLLRVFITVFLVAFISASGTAMINDIWVGSVLVGIISFVILWIGLGIGLIRTIIAVLIVMLLRSLMQAAFSTMQIRDYLGNTAFLS
jgi:hypothetical protein